MELYSVNLQPYKRVYARAMLFNILAVITGYLLVLNGFFVLPPFYRTQNITRPILFAMIAGGFLHAMNYRKRVRQLGDYEDFDEKLVLHLKIYKSRMVWFTISCISSVFLYVLSGHNIFLYLSLFDLFIFLPSFPNKILMQKELKNDEIIFM